MKETKKLEMYSGSRNIGIDLLRIWMCFEVVLIHFWIYDEGTGNIVLDFLSWNRMIAVSCFMYVSFLLSGKFISYWKSEPQKLLRRLLRLSIPLIIWAIIYFAVYYVAQTILHIDFGIGITDLLWQIILGHSYNMPMWFMNDLLYLTLIFIGICSINSKRVKTVFLLLLVIASFIIQYTGLHGYYFGDLQSELKYPLGRGVEMIPYACTGILFCMYDFIEPLKNRKTLFIPILLMVALTMFFLFNIPVGYNFGSAGLKLYIISITVSLIMISIPFESLPKCLLFSISFVAKHCLGIYCLHSMIGAMLNKIVMPYLGLPENTFGECVVIFVLSLCVCYLISKIPFKWCKMIVS